MLRVLADNVGGKPRAVLALTAGLFAVAVVFGGSAPDRLDTSGNPFIDSDSKTARAREVLERASGENAEIGLVALVDAGAPVMTARARARVDPVARRLERDPAVARALSLYETRDPAQVSRDGRSTYVVAVFRNVPDDEVEDAVDRLKRQLKDAPGVMLGGARLARLTIGDQAREDIARAEALAFPIIFALSLVFFRGLVAALLPLFVGALTISGTFLGLRLINEAAPLSVFALNLVIGLGLGLAIDYSLFIVSRYREEIGHSGPGREALQRTLATAGRTVLYSTLTVAAALAALLLFPQQFLYSMGVGGVLVALLAAATSLIALPALLAVLGSRVNALAPTRWQRASERVARDERAGAWYWLSRAVMRRPALVATVTTAALLLTGTQFLRIDFTAFSARDLPPSSIPHQVNTALTTQFPRSSDSSLNVAVTAGGSAGGKVAELARRIEQLPGAAAIEGPRYLGASTWRLNVLSEGDPLSDRAQDLVREIRSLATPLKLGVTGQTADFVDQQASLASHLPLGIAVLCLVTFTLLFLFTGSVILPLKSLIMNVLSLSAAFGLLVLIFQDGRLEGVFDYESTGALEATQPVLLFALAFGLSTDYAVFLLSRIKEARERGLPNREAVAHGLERTGRIVTAAAVLFCVAIGAFATSEVTFIKQLGIGTALAVIIDATVIRALLVPSLMALLGSRNWWAPLPLRQLHARINFNEPRLEG